MTFKVYADSAKVGELRVSKGGVEWKPPYKQVDVHKFTWERFAEIMQVR